MFNKLKIGQKFILFFSVITVGPLLTVAYLGYSNSKYQLERKIVREEKEKGTGTKKGQVNEYN